MGNNIKLKIIGCNQVDSSLSQIIQQADKMILRDSHCADWLTTNHFSFDQMILFTSDKPISDWYDSLRIKEDQTIAYVTTIPFYVDQAAQYLQSRIGRDQTEWMGNPAVVLPGDGSQANSQPVILLDAITLHNKYHPPFSADQNILIYDPLAAGVENMARLLTLIFPKEHSVSIWQGDQNWKTTQISQLNSDYSKARCIFIPAIGSDYSLESFQEVIAHLRAPEDGCPWDRKQTHASLRQYLLEETYEALDALDKEDLSGLREELGDILLQILLHAQIAVEAGAFSMADVIAGINRKIIYRHPHVFKDWVVEGESDVLQNWESLKVKERKNNGKEDRKGLLDGVPVSFPALAQAQAIQDRAARVGFDWPEITPVLDKVMEELEEVKTAPNEQERGKELGDLLFAVVNLIRWYKVDAESALRQTNLKFRKRFGFIEEQSRAAGKDLHKMTLAEMDELWEQAKQFDD